MYVCLYLCMNICMHVCMEVFVCLYLWDAHYLCVNVCMYDCMHVFLELNIQICKNVWVFIYMHASMYVFLYVMQILFACMYMCTYIVYMYQQVMECVVWGEYTIIYTLFVFTMYHRAVSIVHNTYSVLILTHHPSFLSLLTALSRLSSFPLYPPSFKDA